MVTRTNTWRKCNGLNGVLSNTLGPREQEGKKLRGGGANNQSKDWMKNWPRWKWWKCFLNIKQACQVLKLSRPLEYWTLMQYNFVIDWALLQEPRAFKCLIQGFFFHKTRISKLSLHGTLFCHFAFMWDSHFKCRWRRL